VVFVTAFLLMSSFGYSQWWVEWDRYHGGETSWGGYGESRSITFGNVFPSYLSMNDSKDFYSHTCAYLDPVNPSSPSGTSNVLYHRFRFYDAHNIIQNGGFEQDLDYWSTSGSEGGSRTIITSDESPEGYKMLSIYSPYDTSGSWSQVTQTFTTCNLIGVELFVKLNGYSSSGKLYVGGDRGEYAELKNLITGSYGSVTTNKWYRVFVPVNDTTAHVWIKTHYKMHAYIDGVRVYCKKSAENITDWGYKSAGYAVSPLCDRVDISQSFLQSLRSNGWEDIVTYVDWKIVQIPEQKAMLQGIFLSSENFPDYPQVTEIRITKPFDWVVVDNTTTGVEFEFYLDNNVTYGFATMDIYSLNSSSYVLQNEYMSGVSCMYSPKGDCPPYYKRIDPWTYGYGSFIVYYHIRDARGNVLTTSKSFDVVPAPPEYAFTVTPSSDTFQCSYGSICQRFYTIKNLGSSGITVTISSDKPWILPQVTNVYIASGEETTVTVNYDSSYGSIGQTLTGNLIFHEDHVGDEYVPVEMTITGVYVPSTASIDIVDVTPNNPKLGEHFYVTLRVKNLDTTAHSLKVGLTLGEDFVKIPNDEWYLYGNHFCSGDCYVNVTDANTTIKYYSATDIWIETYNMNPNEVREIQVEMVARQYNNATGQGFIGGEVLDVIATVRNISDTSQIFDWDEKDDMVTIREGDYFAYAYAVSVDNPTPHVGDLIRIKVWFKNNGTVYYNYSLGLSIGKWDATDKHVYKYFPVATLPPCNKFCYRDDKGDFDFALVPPTHSAYFERILEIPSYFTANTSYDVAVGIWKEPNPDPSNLISEVVFKDVFNVTEGVPAQVQAGESIKSGLDMVVTAMSIGFNVDVTTAKYMIWSLLIIVAVIGSVYLTRSLEVSILVFISMCIAGALIKWFPAWVTIIFTIIAGALFAMIGGHIFAGR